MQGPSLLFTLVPLAILLLGFIGIIIAEVLLLKRKGWVEANRSTSYPVFVGLVNIPVGFIAYLIASVVTIGIGFFVIPIIVRGLGDNVPLMFGISFLITGIITFFIFMTAFSLARAVITMVMVKSSSLTWKYWFGQGAVLAALFTLVFLLLVASISILPLLS